MSTKGLATSLFPLTRCLVLRELVLASGKPLHIRELARLTGLNANGVHREIRNLLTPGIIIENRSGNQKLYTLNKRCPIYEDIRSLIIKTIGVADRIREALEPLKDKIHVAFIYGSFAAGTENSESDVDLMIVGDVRLRTVSGALLETRDELRKVINSTILGKHDFEEELKKKDGFIARITRGKKIFLIGDLDDS
jgi:predicted nucleotidyltransferase